MVLLKDITHSSTGAITPTKTIRIEITTITTIIWVKAKDEVIRIAIKEANTKVVEDEAEEVIISIINTKIAKRVVTLEETSLLMMEEEAMTRKPKSRKPKRKLKMFRQHQKKSRAEP